MTDDVPLPIRLFRRIACIAKKNPRNSALITLILITGGFFYLQKAGFPHFLYAQGQTDNSVLSTIVRRQICLARPEDDSASRQSEEKDKKDNTVFASACANPDAAVPVVETSSDQRQLEEELYRLVGEAPIREMVPAIAKHDRAVAALVIGIARKESSWGEHIPTRDGERCYNYWGYRGVGSRGTAMGYGCFATPEEGVQTIAGRLSELVKQGLETPAELIVWKCGRSCAGHDPQGVKKWISDVDHYYQKIVREG